MPEVGVRGGGRSRRVGSPEPVLLAANPMRACPEADAVTLLASADGAFRPACAPPNAPATHGAAHAPVHVLRSLASAACVVEAGRRESHGMWWRGSSIVLRI